jgi:hypothetical protein
VSLLARLPAGATTGIGSLPHADPRAAARHAARAYDLPFCPQLPRRDGDMVREWLGAPSGHCGWSAERDRARPHAWGPWLAQLRAAPPAHGVVKLQVTGPLTLCRALQDEADPGPPALAADVAAWLAAHVREQVALLAEEGLTALVVVDEPGLAALAGHPGVEATWDPLRAVAPAWGLHVCGPVPWPLVAAAAPDLLSLDVATRTVDAPGARTLRALLRRGGRVAWGCTPADGAGGPVRARARLAAALAAVAGPGLDLAAVLRASLVTGTCGTGAGRPEGEERMLAALPRLRPGVTGASAPLHLGAAHDRVLP